MSVSLMISFHFAEHTCPVLLLFEMIKSSMFGIYFSEETGSTNILKPYYEFTVICFSGLGFNRYKIIICILPEISAWRAFP